MDDDDLQPGDVAVGAQTKAKRRSYRRYIRRVDDMGDSENNLTWLVTFTDIMGLMLTFFVMMFAMAEPEKEQYASLVTAMASEFNTSYGRTLNAGPEDSVDMTRIDYDRALDIRYLEALIKSIVAENEALRTNVNVSPQGDHLLLSMPQDLLFAAGDVALKPESTRPLFVLGGAFSRMKNAVELVGHTGPRQSESGENAVYSSNWELSLARAVMVAAALDKVGYTEPVIVRGASDGRYQDLSKITDENQRLDLSRRVDIDIMNHDSRRKRIPPDSVLP